LNPETLFFLAKITVGGFGVTIAQVMSRVIHRRTGETKYIALYWFATALSVFVSIHTFYTGNKMGAVQAKYSTAQYETLLDQRTLQEERLRALQGEFNTYLNGEYERKRAKYWYTVAESERQDYVKRINEAADKVEAINKKLLNYQDNEAKETVTNDSTYEGIANDIVTLFDYLGFYEVDPRSPEILVIIMNYFVLIGFALIPDLVGPFFIAYGIVGAKGGTRRQKEEPGSQLMRRLWAAATDQPMPIEAGDRELEKLKNKPFSRLKSHELKLLLKDAKSIVDVIPTLKTRIFMEAAPDSGKTTLIQMLMKRAMAKGEMLPNNSKLYIFDLQDPEQGKWPAWARVFGQGQNIESVKEGFSELRNLKEQGKQKQHVFVIVDEGMEMAGMYEQKYKKQLGDEYSWIISFARQKGFSLLFSTVVGTGKAVGTEGMARIKGAYAYKLNLLYHPTSRVRCALLQVGGMEPDYYSVPNIREIERVTKPNIGTMLQTKASQVVRVAKQGGTALKKIVPVKYEELPDELESYQGFEDTGTENRTTPVPPVPAEYERESEPKQSKIVPLRTSTSVPPYQQNRTTFGKSVPPDIRKAYQQVTEEQERLIIQLMNENVSDNNIIKEVFGSRPTPKFRKWLKAVRWMNGTGKERMVN
jgi:hypothetical protein